MRLTSRYLKIGIGVVAVVVLLLIYHVAVVVPKEVRELCDKQAMQAAAPAADYRPDYSLDLYTLKFNSCLHSHGLQAR